MSNIQEFKEKYSSDNALENELSKIEKMDISNIQKIDLREKVKEKYRIEPEWFTAKNWYSDNIEDDDAFERRNELGRWGM
ncbi:hypothetical protein MNB_SV-3-154 [hydrothermal vent metagenome]|uniref:Uncharacterized protein n=1 Tax=hydrothermal vent metagenome TaxID=652676 RepID=A0A1W1BR61_9ZZZZ